MKFCKYWYRENKIVKDAEGYAYDLNCWAGSNSSLDDARSKATDKLKGWVNKLVRGESIGDYEYHAGDIREELIEEIFDEHGTLLGAITRNRYGALILNAASVLFADIDIEKPSLLARLLRLFGKKAHDKAWHLQQIEAFQKNNPKLSMIIYETFNGFRVVVSSQQYEPEDKTSKDILKALGSDDLYRRLCRVQGCFRARLSPKPWRCGSSRPPNTFPRMGSQDEYRFKKWLADYNEKSKQYDVCQLVKRLGAETTSVAIKKIIDIHASYVLHEDQRLLA